MAEPCHREVCAVVVRYVAAAIGHFETDHGLLLPRSRRVAAQCVRTLPVGGDDASAQSLAKGTAVDLHVRAFLEQCVKAGTPSESCESMLDRVLALALEHGLATCTALELDPRERTHHG